MNRFLFDTVATLNGWIADEQNSLDWLFAVEGGAEPDASLVPQNATVLVEGSTTYQWVLEHEDILTHPEKWRNFHGDRPTFAFTTRALPSRRARMSGSCPARSPTPSPPSGQPPETATCGSSAGESSPASSSMPARSTRSPSRSRRFC